MLQGAAAEVRAQAMIDARVPEIILKSVFSRGEFVNWAGRCRGLRAVADSEACLKIGGEKKTRGSLVLGDADLEGCFQVLPFGEFLTNLARVWPLGLSGFSWSKSISEVFIQEMRWRGKTAEARSVFRHDPNTGKSVR